MNEGIEKSVFSTIQWSKEAVSFEQIVERVQKQSPDFSRNAIAAELGALITRQRVFLNQACTGFCAVRVKRDAQRNLERAVMLSHQPSRVQF